MDEVERNKKRNKRLKHEIIAYTIAYYESKMRKAKKWENELLFDEEIEELDCLSANALSDTICRYFEEQETLREYFKRIEDEKKFENELKTEV